MLKEGDDAVHGPDWGKGRDREDSVKVKTKGRKTGAGSVEV